MTSMWLSGKFPCCSFKCLVLSHSFFCPHWDQWHAIHNKEGAFPQDFLLTSTPEEYLFDSLINFGISFYPPFHSHIIWDHRKEVIEGYSLNIFFPVNWELMAICSPITWEKKNKVYRRYFYLKICSGGIGVMHSNTVCLGSRNKSTRAHDSLLKNASDQKKLLG